MRHETKSYCNVIACSEFFSRATRTEGCKDASNTIPAALQDVSNTTPTVLKDSSNIPTALLQSFNSRMSQCLPRSYLICPYYVLTDLAHYLPAAKTNSINSWRFKKNSRYTEFRFSRKVLISHPHGELSETGWRTVVFLVQRRFDWQILSL